MSTTISASNGAGSSSPVAVLAEYSATRASRNVIHNLIGGGIAVSLVAPNPRSGVVEYLFADETAAWSCLALHANETTFVLTETSVPPVSMTYVVDGEVSIRLDQATSTAWIVAVGYQEIVP